MLKLLKFELPTCGDCKTLEFLLKSVLKEFPDVEYERCHALEDPRGKSLGVRGVPTLVLLDGDEEKGRIPHMTDASSIRKLLSSDAPFTPKG